ncbi:hypothetical protein OHA25_21065 [Nonomuraea sp. NBC_00507]|uniref:hypothetical protein n=1 Tax=Nonomuraea sp. NBC_00507 TaxID=2976002 RepID=UPI002E18EBA6
MYRQGLVLLGLVGGMLAFGGSALAATPAVTAESVQANILPDLDNTGNGEGMTYVGERNNFGQESNLVKLDVLSNLLRNLPISILSSS